MGDVWTNFGDRVDVLRATMAVSMWIRRLLGAALVTLLVPVSGSARQAGTSSTQQIFEALGVREGQTVCEMGAGDGELTRAAARLVGPRGRVYTSELGEKSLATLREKVADNKDIVTVVEGAAERTNFPDGACDAVFMRNVYHHFADPAAMNASISAALAPEGRVAISDFGPPPGKEAPTPDARGKDGTHGVTAATVERELRDAGFVIVQSQPGTNRGFLVVASKNR
jgi:ubiquinone/menaquinone biosynthesis C-methylase UbiE